MKHGARLAGHQFLRDPCVVIWEFANTLTTMSGLKIGERSTLLMRFLKELQVGVRDASVLSEGIAAN